MIKSHRYFFCAASAALSTVASSAAHASVVSPNDTFSIEAIAYNTADPSGDYYIINPSLAPVFGTTQTFANDALSNQTLTVTSSESIALNGAVTDTITLSVPTNFVPAGYVDNNGNPINAIQFSIGADLGATNPLDFLTPVTSYVASGTVTFNSSGTPTTDQVPQQNPMLASNGTSYSDFFEVFAPFTSGSDPLNPGDASPVSADDVTAVSFTVVNGAVPEPSTWAAMLAGGGLLGLTFRRRFRQA